MSRKKQTCAYCEKPATVLCDFLIDIGAMYRERVREDMPIDVVADIILNPVEIYSRTCDKPMCDEHTTQRGVMFFCGKGPAAGVDTRDFCRGHANGPERHPRLDRNPDDPGPGGTPARMVA